MAEDTPQRLVVRPSGPLILRLISSIFEGEIILWSYMSLETGQILQDSGLSATTLQLWGPKSDLWWLFLAHKHGSRLSDLETLNFSRHRADRAARRTGRMPPSGRS